MAPLHGVPWEDLAVLLAGLDQRSLSRAARQLRISQSTASRRLVRLEDRLGARLFDRTPEGLRPTAFAMALAPHAEGIADQMAHIARLASGQEASPSGRVRLAVVDGLAPHMVIPGLAALRALHPGIQLDLLAGQGVLDLVRREADLALRFVWPSAPDLVVRKLAAIEVRPFAHPDLAALAGPMPWVKLYDPERRFHETRWIYEHAAPEHVTRVTAWSDLFASARAGVGAALLASAVAEPAGLVRVPVAAPPPVPSPLLLVYHQALRDVPRIAAVREWLVRQASRLVDEAIVPVD